MSLFGDNPCPRCGAGSLGEVIPPHINIGECYGPQGTRWHRHIGLECPAMYDEVCWWRCCECEHVWKRFPWAPDYQPGEKSMSLKQAEDKKREGFPFTARQKRKAAGGNRKARKTTRVTASVGRKAARKASRKAQGK